MVTARPAAPHPATYAGLFLLSLATLMHEIVLTRIFSVLLWYHFAFVAISVALFGMTVGALIVSLRPGAFPAARLGSRMALGAYLFSLLAVVSLVIAIRTPPGSGIGSGSILPTALGYAAIALPFIAGGISVCLALTRHPAHAGSLYAADLLGAGAGCLLVIPALDRTDGPAAVFVVGCIGAIGAALFARQDGASGRGITLAAVATAAVFLGLLAVPSALGVRLAILRVDWAKGHAEAPPLYERWNAFSRVTVFGDPDRPSPPRGWGLSEAAPAGENVRQLMLLIDSGAGSVLTGFDGRPETVDYLKFDVTNLPHHLRPGARVGVIGAGGGRDLLSAIAFGQPSITAIEINPAVLDAVNERFGEFTGHLDRRPDVRFVQDEARSWIARQTGRPFDILQISLIDTWAATAAGGFALSENALYTREAWGLFLDRLTDRGLLSVSRFFVNDAPIEVYRMTALASAALADRGVGDPRGHIAVVKQGGKGEPGRPAPVGMATLLVSPAPLTSADLETLERIAAAMQFEIVLSPRAATDPVFAGLASVGSPALAASFPMKVAAPTDDSPFFFHTLRLRDAFHPAVRSAQVQMNMKAVSVLGALLVSVVALTVLCVMLPLAWTRKATVRGRGPLVAYFAAIGFGFILVEISQMQRLILFLGHPIYGLSVVLLVLLVAGGVGSALSKPGPGRLLAGRIPGGLLVERIPGWLFVGRIPASLLLLLALLVVFGLATPAVIRSAQGATTPVRVALAAGLLAPLGLLMGTAFPLGLAAAARGSAPGEGREGLTAWLWGINGATSVCGSVLAVAIALQQGLAAAFWTGTACYAVAALAIGLAARPEGDPTPSHGDQISR